MSQIEVVQTNITKEMHHHHHVSRRRIFNSINDFINCNDHAPGHADPYVEQNPKRPNRKKSQ